MRKLNKLYSDIVLTDALPIFTTNFKTGDIYSEVSIADKLIIDVLSDKGCNVTIQPYLDKDKTVLGELSTALTVADGGGAKRGIYSDVGAEYVRIVCSKTEAGDMTSFALSVKGV